MLVDAVDAFEDEEDLEDNDGPFDELEEDLGEPSHKKFKCTKKGCKGEGKTFKYTSEWIKHEGYVCQYFAFISCLRHRNISGVVVFGLVARDWVKLEGGGGDFFPFNKKQILIIEPLFWDMLREILSGQVNDLVTT